MRQALSLLLTLLVAAAALGAPATASADTEYAPGEVVVRYERGADQQAVERAAGVGAAEVVAPRTRVVRIRDGASVADTVRELQQRPDVATAAPNVTARISGFIPDDPGRSEFAGGWQLLQWNFLPGNGVNAPDAWEHLINAGHPGGRGVTVAVLDTGVAYSSRYRYRRSTDFRSADFVRGYDFVGDDRFPYDLNGHGTHVASTIGESTDNRRGVTGLAYGAQIMPVRVLDRNGAGRSADITRAIRFAVRRGADVINLSFEFDTGTRQFLSYEIPDVLAALRFAHRRGVVVVAAAGNFMRSEISYPARAPDVISVGATTEHGCRAFYSNFGSGLDLAAPGGGDGGKGCPEKLGRDIYQTTFPWAAFDRRPRSGVSYRRFGLPSGFEGTSMAAPHVSATAALVLASGVLGRDPTPEAVERRLESTAVDLGPEGPDERFGAGRLDAAAATDPEL